MLKKKDVADPLEQKIVKNIFLIRGKKVMLDYDLSVLYGVETKYLKRQVNRNIERFHNDFMFTLRKKEFENLRSQIGTSSWGGIRYLPMAFSEHGIAMLSSILNSKIAIQVNIRIIRIFIKLRETLLEHKDILLKLEQLEKQVGDNSHNIQLIFSALKKLLIPPQPPRQRIGFRRRDEQ